MELISTGREFMSGASGKWAAEQFMRSMKAGKVPTAKDLRTLDLLRKDEWKAIDEAIIEEGQIRLRGVADLISAGLVRTVKNGLGKTVYEYERVSQMDDATLSLDGLSQQTSQTVDFDLNAIPLPITHKDYYINLRRLMASRERGEALDTTQARQSARRVAEMTEYLLFRGTTKKFGGMSIQGYTTFTHRNTGSYQTNGAWSNTPTKTGANVLEDALYMRDALVADRFYGPFMIYVSANSASILDEDFKANGDKTIRERILEVDQIMGIKVVDQLPADTVVMVQMTSDVVTMVQGEPLQNIQWDTVGGFQVNYKVFTIMVPLLRADIENRSGIFHMS
jgi:uncharacterized linocin/CFP29 family protein